MRRTGREGCKGEGGREGGLFLLPSAVEGDGDSSGRLERKEERMSLPSLCMQINRIPEHRCHMTTRSLHCADTAKREGLCQLSDDVMIYFEEVMSGLCSEAAQCYNGCKLQLHRFTAVKMSDQDTNTPELMIQEDAHGDTLLPSRASAERIYKTMITKTACSPVVDWWPVQAVL